MTERAKGAEMATRIGVKTILAMQPNMIIWDDKVRGFNARRQFGDAVTFSVFYRTKDGRQRFLKIGRFGVWTPEQARKEASRVLMAVDIGKDPSGDLRALRNSLTMAQLCDEYSKEMQGGHVNKKISTIRRDLSRISIHIRPKLGQLKAVSVTQENVEAFMRDMSPGSARRVIALLSGMFAYSVKRKMRSDNPCHGLELPKSGKRLRRLSTDEYAQLGRALKNGDCMTADMFLLISISGWRSGEVRLLKRSEVDLERRVAVLGDTKTGQSVRPLSGAAVEIIRRQPIKNGQFIFEYNHAKPISNLTPWWKKLKMPDDVSPHVLRHSIASLAADMLIPDHLISGLLGHSRNSITSKYMHLSDYALIETADRVADATLKLMKVASPDMANATGHEKASAL
jgi:integrase